MSYKDYEDKLVEKNICKIDDCLYLGNWLSSKKIPLEKFNIKHVVNIGFELDENEKLEYVTYENIELDDNTPSINVLLEKKDDIVKTIKNFVDKNENTLVCCVMGKSRSPSIIMCYLKSKYADLSYNDALNMINEKRSININYGFKEALKNIVYNESI